MVETSSLIRRILAGDREAFKTIVEEYQRLVCHIVFRMVFSPEDREDLCQVVFIKVYQNLSSFKLESKFSSWIARIAYNACIDHLKKKKMLSLDDFPATGSYQADLVNRETSPDEYTEKGDLSTRLKTEMEKMPVHFRTILTLYHLEEMSYAEISEIMQLPEGTVKSYLFRARGFLKNRLLTKYQKEGLWS
jgi:RNA polymerase sigma-70 factor (ECF subfamily)